MPDRSSQKQSPQKSIGLDGPLKAIILRRTRENEFRFSAEEIRHALPMFILPHLNGELLQQLDPALVIMIGVVGIRAGVKTDMTKAQVGEKLRAYYEANPPNPDLMEELRQLLMDDNSAEALQALAKAAGKVEEMQLSARRGLAAPTGKGVGLRSGVAKQWK